MFIPYFIHNLAVKKIVNISAKGTHIHKLLLPNVLGKINNRGTKIIKQRLKEMNIEGTHLSIDCKAEEIYIFIPDANSAKN